MGLRQGRAERGTAHTQRREARVGVGGSTGTKPGRRAGRGGGDPPHTPTATAHGHRRPGSFFLPSFTEAPASNRRTAAGPGDGRRGAPVLPGRQHPVDPRPTAGSGHAARRGRNPGESAQRRAAPRRPAGRRRGTRPRGAAPRATRPRREPPRQGEGRDRRRGGRGRARIPDARRWWPAERGAPSARTTAAPRRGHGGETDGVPEPGPPPRRVNTGERHGTATVPPTHNPGRPQDRVRREGSPPRGTAAATALSASSPLSLSRGRGRPPPRHRHRHRPHTHTHTHTHTPHPTPATAGRTRRGEAGAGAGFAGSGDQGHGARGRPPCLHLGGRRAPADPGPARTNPQPRHPPGATDPWGERLIVKRRSDRRSPGRNPGPQVRSKCR